MSNCRLEQHRKDGTLIGYICLTKRRPCTDEECQQCPNKGDINSPKWAPSPEATPRELPRPALNAPSKLAGIADTLSPAVAGRDRPMQVRFDGVIAYTKQSEDEEPPKDISGYERDPNNAWQFFPLWMPCDLRHQTAVRLANCGCIEVIMRCNNPACPIFGRRVSFRQCAGCLLRKTLET
ncbi:MAG: hypothetical protein ABFC88_12795 [Thermoguttaceae bacterium]